MGAANSVRKLSVDSIALLEQLEPNAAELVAKRQVRQRVQTLLREVWPSCRVLAFGSSESGLGFGGCDLDLGVYFDDVDMNEQGHFSPQERIQLLLTACERLGAAFQVKQFIRNARVPVIKLWDPKRQVACDVCVGGVNALLNTALLKYYGQVDPRVRPLVFAVKYWAKQRGINDSANGTLSSYGFALLLIFFLQSQYAEVQLPSVVAIFQSLHTQTKISVLLDRLQALPAMDLPSSLGTCDLDSVGALLTGFFQFYAHRFNVEDQVVSVRTGRTLSKTTKWSRPVAWRLSIEDPFELTHDVGRVIFHRKGQELLRTEFQRACELIQADRRLEDVCSPDASSWSAMANCYICLGRDHSTRDCGQLAHQRLHLGGKASSLSCLADCWYCGEYGHLKANCPMLFFRHIPLPSELEPTAATVPVPFPPASPPIATPVACTLSTSPRLGKHRVWDRGWSPSGPSTRPCKKKRSRHGSTSSSCSTSSASSLASRGSAAGDREKPALRSPDWRRRQCFPLVETARKCGGAGATSDAKASRPHVGKILCPS